MKFKNILIASILAGAFASVEYAAAAPMEGVEETQRTLTKKDRRSQSNIIPIIALLIGISGAGVGVFSFIRCNKTEESVKKLQYTHKKELDRLRADVSALSNTVDNLKHQLMELNVQLRKVVSARPVSVADTGLPHDAEITQRVVSDQSRYTSKPQPVQVAPVKLFFGIPVQGNFTGSSTNYIEGKSLYYILAAQGANTAQYSYIDDVAAASVASRSISRFVEAGCIVKGEVRNNFSKVITVKPGTVTKTSAGWRIDSKAVVELV